MNHDRDVDGDGDGGPHAYETRKCYCCCEGRCRHLGELSKRKNLFHSNKTSTRLQNKKADKTTKKAKTTKAKTMKRNMQVDEETAIQYLRLQCGDFMCG